MKKLVMIGLLSFLCNCIYAQLQGDFYRNNMTGEVFFYLDNPSPYYVNFMWSAVNYDKNEKREEYCVLPPYHRLTVGPNNGWRWEVGEYFFIVSNYQNEYWRCQLEDLSVRKKGYNPSFKGHSSCHNPKHNCPYGIDNNTDGWCDNCLAKGYKCKMVKHQGN